MTAPPGIERVLFTEEQVNQRIREVAAEISAKYQGRDLKLIAVLKGAVFFLTALARAIEIPLKVDFLAISSFGIMLRAAHRAWCGSPRTWIIRFRTKTSSWWKTSWTPASPRAICFRRWPDASRGRSGSARLLDRTARRIVQVPVDYRCFEIPDRFVVGCGLDFQQRYRNLGYIAVMDPEKS